MVTSTNVEASALGTAPLANFALDGTFQRQPVTRVSPLPVYQSLEGGCRYYAGVVGFTPVATATDIVAIAPQFYGRTTYIDRVTISGTATSASVIDVLLQRSSNGGGGTTTTAQSGYARLNDPAPTSNFYSFTANRSSGGNGISTTRHLIAPFKLYLGTASVPVAPTTITFTGKDRPTLQDLGEWFVINLNGQTIPAGCSLNITVHWTERAIPQVLMAGDSTTSNATALFRTLSMAGELNHIGSVKNRGSNGAPLSGVLLNSGAPAYPWSGGTGIVSQMGSGVVGAVLVHSYGINDLRQGLTTREELISLIDASIYAALNGTTSGQTYTSTMGAGSTYTWTGTCIGNPDAKIILWGPNPLASDDPGATGWVSLSGRWAGMTTAQAAQAITDDLREAYAAFANDPRVFRLVQKQDVLGITCKTVAVGGFMTDILHPNARGQTALARQIYPHILDAVHAAYSDLF